jgi:hypothetical protein
MSEMNEQLDRIEKMLETILRNDGHIWWIGGFVYGRTSNDDPFVILYPASEKLNEKVVRVYSHDFKKLPGFIPTADVPGDTEANPNKAAARKKGIYHECPLFEVTTYDGKETQMGPEQRFGDVLRVSRKAQEQPSAQSASPQAPPEGRGGQTPPPPTPDDIDWSRPATQPALVGGQESAQGLPDYRAMAVAARTEGQFDYAAFMALRNGLFDDQERITKVREILVPGWKPASDKVCEAMLMALQTYRDKRTAAQGRGEEANAAHQFAKKEARNVYNKVIK